MMDNLRAASNHVVLKILLGLIILSFVLTGVGGYLTGGNGDYAAKVNGQEISRAQLERAFSSERARQQQMLGEQYSALAGNEGYMQQMRQQALSQLVDELLLNKYAKDIGLAISDAQIKQTIFTQPAFQTDGKFDNAKYLAQIDNIGVTADQYAEALRTQMTIQQLVQSVTGTDFVLGSESDSLVALVAQQRLVREVTINTNAPAVKQSVTPEEINNYYQQNKSNFMSPEQFRVSYIKLNSLQEPVSENDIQSWYDQHQQDYIQPQRDRFSIIQSKTEADAQVVLDELKKGADFAALAKEKSSDPISAPNGGDLGWLEPDNMPDELKNAGLNEKDQLSDVIESSVGFIVARLDDVQPEQIKTLAEVHDDIAAKVKQDAYDKLLEKVGDAASADTNSLASAEEAAGVKAVETSWFSHDNLPAELNFKPVEEAIFNGGLADDNGTPGHNSDIIAVDDDSAFVLRISEHKSEAVKPLSEVTAQIVDLLKQQKAHEGATLADQQSVTPEEINNYYQQNKSSFMSPEQFRVSYIKLDAASLQEPVSESDIQSWYDQHQQDYTQPQRERFSIIQSKTEADAQVVLDELKKGGDFAALAKEKSSDPISARNGGDMGWLEPDSMPDELKNAGLNEKGQLSGVIKSSVGFIVARLDDVQPEQIKTLAEVHDDIVAKVKQEKAVDAYYKLQQKVSDAASNDTESLTSAEEAAGVKAVETGWFSHDNLPAELNFKPVEEAIFNGGLVGDNGAPGRNSDIITVDGDRAFVLRISDHKPETVKPLSEVSPQITDMLKRQKSQAEARIQAEKLLADLKAGKGDEALKAMRLSFGTQQTLVRTDRDPLVQVAFALPLPSADKASYGIGEDIQGNVVLLALDKVQSGELSVEQKKALIQGITQNNAEVALGAMLSNLRKDAKIKYGVAAEMQ